MAGTQLKRTRSTGTALGCQWASRTSAWSCSDRHPEFDLGIWREILWPCKGHSWAGMVLGELRADKRVIGPNISSPLQLTNAFALGSVFVSLILTSGHSGEGARNFMSSVTERLLSDTMSKNCCLQMHQKRAFLIKTEWAQA